MDSKGFAITEARFLAAEVKLFRVAAPRVARKQKPGQFVILRIHEQGERIPITIAEADPANGTITLIVQGSARRPNCSTR
jgi:ferredoxin--NADP+ reductase